MSKIGRFTFGGLGGLLPLIASLVAVDLTAIAKLVDNHSLTEGLCVGYGVRVVGLIVLGGVMALLNEEVRNPLALVQIGIAAPALVTSYLSASVISGTLNKPQTSFLSTSAYAGQLDQSTILAGGFINDVIQGVSPGLGANLDQQNRQVGGSMSQVLPQQYPATPQPSQVSPSGAHCQTPVGIFGPGPINPVGSPCFVNGPAGSPAISGVVVP